MAEGTKVGAIYYDVNLDDKNFNAAKQRVQSGAQETSMSFGKLAGAVALGQAAFNIASSAVSKVVGVLPGAISKTEDLASSTRRLQLQTGMTAEQASGLVTVFERFGLDADGASKSLGFLSKQIVETAKSSTPAQTALGALGITVKDAKGNIEGTDQVLLSVADKFKTMPDGPQKTALAMQLFGKSGKDLIPILNLGAQGIAELEARAAKFGLTLSQNNIDAIRKNQKAMADYHEAIGGLELRLGNGLMPIITKFATALSNFVASDTFNSWANKLSTQILPQAVSAFDKAWAFITQLAVPLYNLVQAIKNLLSAFTPLGAALLAIEGHMGKTSSSLANVKDGITKATAAINTIASIIQSVLVVAVAVLGTVIQNVVKFIESWIQAFQRGNPFVQLLTVLVGSMVVMIIAAQVALAVYSAAMGVAAAATAAFGAVLAFVTSPIFLIILAIALVIAIGYLLITHWKDISAAASQLWKDVANFFKNLWHDVTSFVGNIVKDVVQFFRDLPGNILKAIGDFGHLLWQAGKDLINGLINGVKSMVGDIGKAIKDVAGGAVKALKGALGIGSPSRVFHELGVNIGEGMVNGLNAHAGEVAAAAANLGQVAVKGAQTPISALGPSIAGLQSLNGQPIQVTNVTINGDIKLDSQVKADDFLKRLTLGDQRAQMGLTP